MSSQYCFLCMRIASASVPYIRDAASVLQNWLDKKCQSTTFFPDQLQENAQSLLLTNRAQWIIFSYKSKRL